MNKVQKLLLGGLMACAAVQAPAATFVGERTDFRDETIYFTMTTRFYDGDQKTMSAAGITRQCR